MARMIRQMPSGKKRGFALDHARRQDHAPEAINVQAAA
jgi:hypothetical protein